MTRGYVADIREAAKQNDYFRKVVFTAEKSQLVLMSLRPGEEIGTEVHNGDQVLYVVDGKGYVVLDDSKEKVVKGAIVIVPMGVRHNVVNTDDDPLKLFTVYAPPQHAAGTVEPRKKAKPQIGAEERWPEEPPPDVDSEVALGAGTSQA